MIVSDAHEGRPSLRIWIFAAVVALVLHVAGAALAIVQLRADEEGGSLGAQGRDIGLDLTSLGTEVVDLPPGPDSEAVQESVAVTEQKAVEKETDLPKDVATETEDPDRIVTQADSKKPEKEEPEPAAVQATAQPEQAASEATAPQVIEDARVAPKQTVVNQGVGKDRERLSAEWARRLSAHFKNHQKYPDASVNKEMRVKVHLALNRLGKVLSVDVVESSGNRLYDEAAIAMIRRSDPVPRPPAKLTDERFEYDLPIIFDKPKV